MEEKDRVAADKNVTTMPHKQEAAEKKAEKVAKKVAREAAKLAEASTASRAATECDSEGENMEVEDEEVSGVAVVVEARG